MPVNFWDNVLASSFALGALLLIMGLVYLIWRAVTLKRKQRYFAELHEELAVGKPVVFGGGIYGTLTEVGAERVCVKVRSGAVLEVSRFSVQTIQSDPKK
ncbi:preprotein translocase subunit YajC [Thermophilibacter immobilis]|jgi:preprotein translocase subunit YajC|uniref:Preprotein translocase subunit YajC n=1 Tax=Thermophilibacter immobilis TaxID=2779519 RepID=A0A7S7M913_9ACTN|nr:preprotein translocase subunit YajC [Thermophilibacter immobilis]QOY60972.1 preprotein translocase subunit YajC [Thermophilibacter immobilis]